MTKDEFVDAFIVHFLAAHASSRCDLLQLKVITPDQLLEVPVDDALLLANNAWAKIVGGPNANTPDANTKEPSVIQRYKRDDRKSRRKTGG